MTLVSFFKILFPFSSLCNGLSPGCRAGTFGPNCKSRCSCINGGRCDFRTGTCYCPPGFIGADCSSSKSENLAPVYTPECLSALLYYHDLELLLLGCWSFQHHSCIGKFWWTTIEATHKAYEMKIFIIITYCICVCTFVWMKTWLFPQGVWVATMGRTVLSCAPVEKEDSATQQLGSVSVSLVGWDSPASKVHSFDQSLIYKQCICSMMCSYNN